MSITRSFYCIDCRVELWAGQNEYIYTTPEALVALRDFLLGHEGHRLRFGSSETMDRLMGPSIHEDNWMRWPSIATHAPCRCKTNECVIDVEDVDAHEEHVRVDGSRFR